MADNLGVSLGADATVRTKDNAGIHLNVAAIADPTGVNLAAVSAAGRLSVDASGVAVPVTDNAGSLTVDDGGGSITVDGSVSISGAVEIVNDLGNPIPVSGTVTAAAQPGIDIGDVTVNNAAGAAAVNIQDGGNSITVDGTVTANLAAGTNNIGDVDVLSVPAPLSTSGGGTEATALRVTLASDSTGVLSVDDNGGSLTVDGSVSLAAAIPAGTNNIGDVDVVSFTAGAIVEVQGDVAHNVAVAGNPVLNGFEGRSTDGTAVTSGNAVRGLADTLGKQVVLLGAVHDRHVRGTANYTTTTASDLIAAGGAGVRTVVTSVLVTNAHATVGTKVEIRDGGTVRIQAFAAAAGGGFALCDPHGLFISTANTAVTGRCVTTGADVDITVSGYTIGN